MTIQCTTLELTAGQIVTWASSLNAPAGFGTVESVEPCMLTAGRYAGQQAAEGRGNKGALLWRVRVVGVVDGAGPKRDVPHRGVINFAVPADKLWDVVGKAC